MYNLPKGREACTDALGLPSASESGLVPVVHQVRSPQMSKALLATACQVAMLCWDTIIGRLGLNWHRVRFLVSM